MTISLSVSSLFNVRLLCPIKVFFRNIQTFIEPNPILITEVHQVSEDACHSLIISQFPDAHNMVTYEV